MLRLTNVFCSASWIWLVASDNGFALSLYPKPKDACANPTTGLHSTNCGSSHVPHVRCKPEGIRPGGKWWRVYGVQPTQTVSKHTHTCIQELELDFKGQRTKLIFCSIYKIQKHFSLLQCFFLWIRLLAEHLDATLAYSATLITLPVCCHVQSVEYLLPSESVRFSSTLINSRLLDACAVSAHTFFLNPILSFIDFSQDLEKKIEITEIYLNSVLIWKLLPTRFTLIQLQLAV